MAKIYSMGSNDVVIPTYKKTSAKSVGAREIDSAIIIKGGANVRDPMTLQTRKFVVTEVTAEELKTLKANPAFMRKVERGFITIDKEPEVKKADKSAQITPEQMKAKTKAEIKTGKAEE